MPQQNLAELVPPLPVPTTRGKAHESQLYNATTEQYILALDQARPLLPVCPS